MRVRQFSTTATTALLLAATGLALTACGPQGDGGSSAAAPGTANTAVAPSTTATPTATTPGSAATPVTNGSTGTPTAGPAKPSATKTTKPGAAPSADCTANAAQVGRVLQAVEVGYSTSVWIKAQETVFRCGPEVPGEGYFEATGPVKVFQLTNEVKSSVLHELKARQLPLQDFMKHLDTCLTDRNSVRLPYGCYGNQFAVTLEKGSGKIDKIDELYRP
ncbi:hypothetical protein ACWCYY_04575 [Kitasatospora sp. NPDC001664]